MPMMITDECIDCGACVPACPNEAVVEGEGDAVPLYWIDAERCSECMGAFDEPQCREVCPIECIEPRPDISESEDELLQKYRRLHT